MALPPLGLSKKRLPNGHSGANYQHRMEGMQGRRLQALRRLEAAQGRPLRSSLDVCS
jgi:hypothetical protein